ncbi:helix-turn-helix transcriptional regulator [Rhodococcus sp. NPDC060176]|uniref:helix-turn-helix transcriptional regulator n=1 Tax=Rhodococcus sp. NPDC060176 TaxID=3347062 RepID=UPI00365C7278
MHTSEDYWLSRQEVADRLKLPVKTLAQWSSLGKGPRFAKIGKFARYKLTDLVAWEDAQFSDSPDAA